MLRIRNFISLGFNLLVIYGGNNNKEGDGYRLIKDHATFSNVTHFVGFFCSFDSSLRTSKSF